MVFPILCIMHMHMAQFTFVLHDEWFIKAAATMVVANIIG